MRALQDPYTNLLTWPVFGEMLLRGAWPRLAGLAALGLGECSWGVGQGSSAEL